MTDLIHVEIREDSLSSIFTLKDGSIRNIGLLGYASDFRDYIEAEYSTVSVEYIEGAS